MNKVMINLLKPVKSLTDPIAKHMKPRNFSQDGSGALAEKVATCIGTVKCSDLGEGVTKGFEQLRATLAKSGMGIENIVKIYIGLPNLKENFQKFNALYVAEMGGHAPARVCIEPKSSEKAITFEAIVTDQPMEAMPGAPSGAPYSAAMKSGNLLYMSGQIAPDKPDFGSQVDAVLGKVRAIAEAAGAKVEDAEQVRVYIVGKEHFTQDLTNKLVGFFGFQPKINILHDIPELPAGALFEVACDLETS